jgi:exonuclease V gamma subunit
VARRQPYVLELGAFRLSGVLPRVHDAGLRQFSASKPHGRTLLGLGIDALAWFALGEDRPVTRCIHDAEPEVLEPIAPVRAQAMLRELLTLADAARLEPLPFMPQPGLVYVQAGDPDTGMNAARKRWRDDFGGGTDPWAALALRGAMPFGGTPAIDLRFAQLSEAVFGALPGIPAAAAGRAAASDTAGDTAGDAVGDET